MFRGKGRNVIPPCFDVGMDIIAREEALKTLSEDAVRRRVRSGKWQELFPGVYLTAARPPTWEELLIGACKWAGLDSAIAYHPAGKLWRFPGIDICPIEIVTPRRLKSPREDVIVHRVRALSKREKTMIGMIPVTSPARTILDLAATLHLGALTAVVQFALRQRLTTWDRLCAAVNEAPRGRRGIAKLRKVLIEGLDSHLERLMKKLVWSSSLPRPLVHHEVASRSGKGLTIDFGYPAERVAIETDGWAFHSDRDAFQRDREK